MSAAVMENQAAPSQSLPHFPTTILLNPQQAPVVLPQAAAISPSTIPAPVPSAAPAPVAPVAAPIPSAPAPAPATITPTTETLQDPFEVKDTPKGVKSMQMQRGEKMEAEIDWDKLRTLFVQDEMGNKIKFTDIFKRQKTIIFLVRHFLDFIAKEYVEDLAVIPFEYLQNAEVRLVVIGPTEPSFIRPFKDLTHYNYTLYTDPDRQVYKALGCLEKLAAGDFSASKHIKSGFISGVTSSIWRAMTSQEKKLQGDPKQQGGSFILGPEEQVHFTHIDQSSVDHCAINDVLTKAGVMNVSFPKDPRIQNI